ncbi:MAG: hypothetical protein ACP5RY_03150 [Thermoplasmata archaeon]
MTSSYIVFQVYGHSTPINAYWVRVREDPPNGVMPTYSFSNILSPTMWHTNLNEYKDQAYSNITSIWSSDIYCDDYGNVFWTDTYGNVFAYSRSILFHVYSMVNSTTIYNYTFPEAEEFTIGSSSETVNYVVLYLSGSGSIKFSIGSSLWGSDILGNMTVNVNSNQIWYNISIPTISLSGGTDYYLNVYQASGNVQWGYTSSPSSSSFNYVQDYWYINGHLIQDNYPNIYTIGFSNLFNSLPSSAKNYLGTPYSHFAYAGPITSIAAVNYSTIAEIVVLTYSGYVFGCYPNNDTWFNATQQWNLPLTSYSPPWTSVTSNVEGYGYGYGYDEGFFFTDLNGNVYFYDTTNPGNSGWFVQNSLNKNIISTVASYKGYLYGITYNGSVCVVVNSSTNNTIWWYTYDNTGITDLVGITMDSSGYLYLLQLNNKTTLYKSSTTAGSTTGTFSPYGSVVFSQGTNEAITYDQYNDIFWAIQTNGTIAGSLNPTKGWGYSNNLLYTYNYPTILAINSTYPINFNAYAYYLTSPDYTNMYNFTLYFTGSNGILDLEYAYQNGTAMNKAQIPALLDSSNGILINVTMMPNVSYNSHFYFYVIFYPQNNLNSVVLEYVLNIRIINHFSYIPIS